MKPLRSPASIVQRATGALRLGRALRLVWESAPGWTLLSSVLVVLQGLVPLAALYLLKLIIDAITAGIGAADPSLAFERVAVLIAVAALVALIGVVLRTAAGLVQEVQSLLVTEHVFGVLHAKSVQLDLAFYEDPAYQDTLHRTQQEAPSRPPLVVNALLGLGRSGVTLVGVLVLLATAHWLLVLLLVLAVLPALWAKVRYANRTYHWMRETAAAERRSNYLNMLLTSPWFATEVRMWGLGRVLIQRFQEVRARLRRERLRISRSRGLAEVAAQAVAAVAAFGAFAFLASQTLVGALTLGALVMYFQAVQKAQGLFTELFGGLASLYEHNLFLSHLEEFLALEPKIVAPARPTAVPRPMRSGLVMENVSFRYPGAVRDAVRGVNLTVRRGEMVALVGANGSGKTTLVKLLCRLYNPTTGSIALDGIDLRDFDPAELRRQIAVIFQEYAIYAVSAKENIWFGDVQRPLDEERVVRVARQTGADEVIRRFPQGYETPLLKMFAGGLDISGGERQKVALARAFYSDAQILVLDEPSSALDAASEIALFEQIRLQASDRAAIVISHRFSTVLMADRIYVLEEGGITEGGTHEELMQLGGTYARLFELQAAQYRRGAAAAPAGAAEPSAEFGLRAAVAGTDAMLVERAP